MASGQVVWQWDWGDREEERQRVAGTGPDRKTRLTEVRFALRCPMHVGSRESGSRHTQQAFFSRQVTKAWSQGCLIRPGMKDVSVSFANRPLDINQHQGSFQGERPGNVAPGPAAPRGLVRTLNSEAEGAT